MQNVENPKLGVLKVETKLWGPNFRSEWGDVVQIDRITCENDADSRYGGRVATSFARSKCTLSTVSAYDLQFAAFSHFATPIGRVLRTTVDNVPCSDSQQPLLCRCGGAKHFLSNVPRPNAG